MRRTREGEEETNRNQKYLPSIPAHLTFTERRHRFVGTTGLGLTIADFLLVTFPTSQSGRHALLGLSDHGFIHVLLFEFLVLGATFGGFEFLVGHDHETLGRDFAGENILAELRVALVLDVEVQRTCLLAVAPARLIRLVVLEDSLFDVHGAFEDVG